VAYPAHTDEDRSRWVARFDSVIGGAGRARLGSIKWQRAFVSSSVTDNRDLSHCSVDWLLRCLTAMSYSLASLSANTLEGCA
jgi:hypothetical protein